MNEQVPGEAPSERSSERADAVSARVEARERSLLGMSGTLLQGAGGVAALALGVLYGLGALLTMADLHAEGVPVRDMIRLIPLPELLSRGIGTIVTLILLVLGIAAFTASWETAARAKAGSRRERASYAVAGALVLVALSLAIFVVPIIVGIGIFVAVFVLLIVATQIKQTSSWDIAAGLAVVILAVAANAYFAPPARPQARIGVKDDAPLRGTFLASSGDYWYIKGGGATVMAVPGDSVESVAIARAPDRELQGSFHEVSGLRWWLAAIVGFGAFFMGFWILWYTSE
jgi:hypothetical protein